MDSSSAMRFVNGVAELRLSNVTHDQAGEYSCQATNPSGMQVTKAVVTVSGEAN